MGSEISRLISLEMFSEALRIALSRNIARFEFVEGYGGKLDDPNMCLDSWKRDSGILCSGNRENNESCWSSDEDLCSRAVPSALCGSGIITGIDLSWFGGKMSNCVLSLDINGILLSWSTWSIGWVMGVAGVIGCPIEKEKKLTHLGSSSILRRLGDQTRKRGRCLAPLS